MSDLFKGKKGLILGVANDRSIAWGIAKHLHDHGAELAFGYMDLFESRVLPLVNEVDGSFAAPFDVTKESDYDSFFNGLGKIWDSFDFVVHSLAYANPRTLQGRYADTSREDFLEAMEISCFSFTKILKHCEKFMMNGGSCLTLSYYGAEKWIPNYNVMGVAKAALEASVRYLAMDYGCLGIRVNAISAGPVRTLSFGGIKGSKDILEVVKTNAPLRRNITFTDVARSAMCLLSDDLSSGVTGEILHVDAGFNTLGMTFNKDE